MMGLNFLESFMNFGGVLHELWDFDFWFNKRYPPSISVTNPLAPESPLKGKGLAKNFSLFPNVKDQTLNQLVDGRSELPLRHNHLVSYGFLIELVLFQT